MKVEYSSDMLLKDLRKDDLEHIYNFCKKSNRLWQRLYSNQNW